MAFRHRLVDLVQDCPIADLSRGTEKVVRYPLIDWLITVWREISLIIVRDTLAEMVILVAVAATKAVVPEA